VIRPDRLSLWVVVDESSGVAYRLPCPWQDTRRGLTRACPLYQLNPRLLPATDVAGSVISGLRVEPSRFRRFESCPAHPVGVLRIVRLSGQVQNRWQTITAQVGASCVRLTVGFNLVVLIRSWWGVRGVCTVLVKHRRQTVRITIGLRK